MNVIFITNFENYYRNLRKDKYTALFNLTNEAESDDKEGTNGSNQDAY